MAKFFTEYLVINEENKIECRKCGHVFCDIQQDYKKHALNAEIIPSEIGPLRPDDDKWCVYREFYCPKCAVLLNVDVVIPGDPIMTECRLDG